MAIYDAHPLALGESTNIRLIELIHDRTPNLTPSIACRLFVVPFDKAPSYTALSYVWGPESPTKSIYVDGYEFVVRQNLWDFLSQCQANGFKEYLWIDALCIDQTSIKERNHQVALMRHIYSDASCVIAWLGEDVGQHFRTVAEVSRTSKRWDLMLLKEEEEDFLDCLRSFLENDYWNRLWVVQEFVLGRTVELWSSDSRMSCKVFAEILMPLEKMSASLITYRWLYHARRLAASGLKTLRSTDLFIAFGTSRCAHICDRVYGLLGLIDQQELKEYPILVDYSQWRYELFVQLWERCLKISEQDRKRGVVIADVHDTSFINALGKMLEISPYDYQRLTGLLYIPPSLPFNAHNRTHIPEKFLASMS